VVVVERRYIGGSCPNVACLPSKNVIHSAKVASYLRRGAEFGLPATDGPVDMAAVRDRKRRMVDGLIEAHFEKYRASGAELVMGSGVFVAPKTIDVALPDGGTRTLRGEVVVVCTGSRARIDDTPGLKESRPLTHIEALDLDQVPEHLVVLGGGYIGLELAQAFHRLGSRVTVVERNETLIYREDPDVTSAVGDLFRDEGIDVSTGTTLTASRGHQGNPCDSAETRGGGDVVIEGTHLLAAGGRTPNTDGIGLERVGIEFDSRGHVR
jgi:pyruvate/2-oxoglutarate dehydrogenase complex dihydrolipoamide dehydrogenase (E3) component